MEPTHEQQRIIDYPSNRVVIAKPGSGKTFTLSCIIKKILPILESYQGVIAISYTRKASKELENRCLGSGAEKKSSFFGTIDKFCISEIIFPFASHIFGLSSEHPRITNLRDEEMITGLGEETINEIRHYLESGEEELPTNILSIIERCHNDGYIILQLVPKLSIHLLSNCTPVLNYLTARYTHIIIDEYQDTGEEQHKIFSLLSENNITGIAVGDVEQSIFGFAGKNPKHLFSLTKKLEFKTFTLSRNHRCHPSIINYSLRLMTAGVELLETDETRVYYRNVSGDEAGLAAWIDQNIEKAKNKYDVEFNNKCAVLVRNTRTGNSIHSSLSTPSKFLVDTELDTDSASWSEVFRGILNIIMDPNGNIVDLITDYFGTFDRGHRNLYANLVTLKEVVNHGEELLNYKDSFHTIASIIHPDLENERSKKLLLDVLGDEKALTNYIPAQNHELQIMTLHKSKGLEFDMVFHLDLYEWIMPSYNAMKGDKEEWAQDINLHYVGISRAKKCCVLLSSTKRHNHNNDIKTGSPSPFLSMNGLELLRNNKKSS